MRPADPRRKQVLMPFIAVLVISLATALAQQPNATSAASKSATSKVPTIWHSEASHKDFRVEVTGDVFRADWVNIPAAAAKNGAYMRIECRRTGTKWVGSSSIYQPVSVPGASSGAETKMCHLTVRFEVDSITPEKITFHSEVMRDFDPSQCKILKTVWEEFVWVPKK